MCTGYKQYGSIGKMIDDYWSGETGKRRRLKPF